MSELLPTPRASDGADESSHRRTWSTTDFNLHTWVRERTSASSPGSEDSTSPLSGSGSDALDRLSGTQAAPESLSDGGPESLDGVTLLPTPSAEKLTPQRREDFTPNLPYRIGELLPTPTATPYGNNQSPSPGAAIRPSLDGLISSAAGSHVSPSAPQAGAREHRTPAGYGLSSSVSLASWDPDTSSWRTFQGSLLRMEDERFPRSWETWPRSGSMHAGIVYEHPTWERPIAGSASLSSPNLPTPNTMPEAPNRNSNQTSYPPSIPGAIAFAQLHTPIATDGSPRYDRRASPGYVRAIPVPNLDAQIAELLPTPTADHARGLAQPGTDYQSLPNAVISFGGLTEPRSEDGSE